MKYLVYILVAVLVLWAIYIVIRHLKRTAKGESCSGDCGSCAQGCSKRTPK